jgi:hypothetical protein
MRSTLSAGLVVALVLAASPSRARAQEAPSGSWRSRLEDPSPEARRKAAGELVALGRKAIPILRAVYAGGHLVESSPVWNELDWIGRELALRDAREALAGVGIPGEPRIVAEVGGFRTLAGYLARREGSHAHWTFTVVDLPESETEVVERAVVVDDLSDQSFVPKVVDGRQRAYTDALSFVGSVEIPASATREARESLIRDRVRTVLAILRLARSPAHSRGELFPKEGEGERGRARGASVFAWSETGACRVAGISMKLGHDWTDIAFAFDPAGGLERIATVVTASCK